ncbi:hypothetical protein L2E82_03828 [Cichorium intybus]|uniref:Uncharacterized protein n=1 Tax=Cichorium intybus TaxID=13427 RepID=A0ACB9H4F6_CICIN|nr:hypothetical protein L2E82_03828 [Cichorium intybus]
MMQVKDVFIPWYNAYRFIVQNAKRLKVEGLPSFVPHDRVTLLNSTNVLGQWINSATHSLVHFVRQEMDAYRLYTVLLTCCKVMAPFTPFFTEVLYCNLQKVSIGSEESIHFCSFPQELNVVSVVPCNDPLKYTTLRTEPNFRPGNSMRVVADAVKALSQEDILSFKKSGQITIATHCLKLSDIKITRGFKCSDGVTTKEMDASSDVVNRIQRLRRKYALEPTDFVEVCFKSLDEDTSLAAQILKSQTLSRLPNML